MRFAESDCLNIRTCLLSETWPRCLQEADVPLLGLVVRADQFLQDGMAEQAALLMGETDTSLAVWICTIERWERAKSA